MNSNVVEDHFLGHGSEAEKSSIAPQTLDVEFLCVPHAAHRLHRAFRRQGGRLRGQQFRHIGFAPVGPAGIAIGRRLVVHEARTFILSMRLGERELQSLVGGDRRRTKHFALKRVTDSELDGEFSGADEAGGRDDSLGIEDIQKFVPPVIQGSTRAARSVRHRRSAWGAPVIQIFCPASPQPHFRRICIGLYL